MSRKFWGIGFAIALVLAAVALLLPLAFQASGSSGPTGRVPGSIVNQIANPPSLNCVAIAKQYKLPVTKEGKVVLTYIPNKVGDKSNERDYTDSVNISAIPADANRINASICTQPEEAGMVGVALAKHYPEFVKLNPGLFKQFVNVTPKEWADKVFSGKITYANETTTVSRLAGFMTIFKATYVKDKQTAWNYTAQDAITTKANVRPIVENDQQYVGDFVQYKATKKESETCTLPPFGINIGKHGDIEIGDQRIAGFTCETPTPPTTTPPPSHGCTTNCGPSTCTSNCGPTPPPCITNCPKDWSKSVPAVPGANPQPNDSYETRPAKPSNPAPVVPSTTTPSSGSQAPGATPPDPNRTTTSTGSGTTSGGSSSTVNGSDSGGNNATPVANPFGGS